MLTHHFETRQHLDPDAAIVQASIKNDECGISFRSYFRYDASIERSYYTGLQQLERLQALRRKMESNRAVTEGSGKVSKNGIRLVAIYLTQEANRLKKITSRVRIG